MTLASHCRSSVHLRFWMHCYVTLTLVLLFSNRVEAYVGPDGIEGIAQDIPVELRKGILDQIEGYKRPRRAAPERPANSLAEECLAAAEAYSHGEKGVDLTMRGAADDLLASLIDGGRKPAWGRRTVDNKAFGCANGGAKDNGDSCDPPDTAYVFQSGVAGACIARVGKLTHDPKYKAFIRKANEFWIKHSGLHSECGGCRYFWGSDVAANNVRFVRNLNLFGVLPILIDKGEWDQLPREVNEVLRAEIWEKKQDNSGYLSALDSGWGGKNKAWESDRIENHLVAVAVILKSVQNITGNRTAGELALRAYTSWANCNNSRCQRHDCRNWSANPSQCSNTYTYGHCAFRQVSVQARESCLAVLKLRERLNANQLLFILMGDAADAH